MEVLRLSLTEIWGFLNNRIGWLILVGIPAIPIIYGLVIRKSYALVDVYDYFTLPLDLVGLVFTLLIAAIYIPRLSDEFSNGFLRVAHTRTQVKSYFASRAIAAGFIAFIVFSLMIITVALVALVIDPLFGLNTYDPRFGTPDPPEDRHTFSQLIATSKWLFVFVYAMWVGISAATYAVIGVLALALIGNRFLALAVPTIIYWGQTYVTAVLGLEAFSASTTVFPFNIIQQPIWTVLVPWIPLLILIALAWAWVNSREFDTAGLN